MFEETPAISKSVPLRRRVVRARGIFYFPILLNATETKRIETLLLPGTSEGLVASVVLLSVLLLFHHRHYYA